MKKHFFICFIALCLVAMATSATNFKRGAQDVSIKATMDTVPNSNKSKMDTSGQRMNKKNMNRNKNYDSSNMNSNMNSSRDTASSSVPPRK